MIPKIYLASLAVLFVSCVSSETLPVPPAGTGRPGISDADSKLLHSLLRYLFRPEFSGEFELAEEYLDANKVILERLRGYLSEPFVLIHGDARSGVTYSTTTDRIEVSAPVIGGSDRKELLMIDIEGGYQFGLLDGDCLYAVNIVTSLGKPYRIRYADE